MPLKIECGQHRVVSTEGVREPMLFRLAGGDLLLTFHVQPDMHFAKRICLRSSDAGRTWQKDPQRAYREQAIGQAADGTVLAPDIYTFERKPGEYVGSYFRSDDGGATFTGPHESVVLVKSVATRGYPTPEHFPPEDHPMYKFFQPLPEYYHRFTDVNNARCGPSFWRYLIEYEGCWLAPMQCRFHGDRFYRTILVRSEDGGRTWGFVSTVADFREGVPGDGFCEPAILAGLDGGQAWPGLPSGRHGVDLIPGAKNPAVPGRGTGSGGLLCIMRRGGGLPLAQCRSYDGGGSWTRPEMLAGHGVDPDLVRISNGALACTYGRPGLHITFSEDGCGFGWGYRTQIGDWMSSSYMGIAEIASGELLLVYDRRTDPSPAAGRDPDNCYIGATTVRVGRASRIGG